ncbi:cytochrome P450 [Intrasporangium oryzae NRRL B-24470]|uniref:Cytochrome P450 n=1 Tax=Intrasporangium oryzae NRRL B-24470 TaxID=1386089 RepID=W9GC03_9MICO|nr:cytochrome P450 [Intrasporangium oryzae NRRL B-24470]
MVDLSGNDVVTDPYPHLAEARARGPVVWDEALQRYVTTTHAAANDALRDRRLGRIIVPRSAPGAGPEDPWTVFDWLHADSILDSEPPKHTRLRRLVAGAFARGHVARLRPRVVEIAERLLDTLEARLDADGSVDVIETFAEPLPVLVICELLGAPTDDWRQLRDWSQAIVAMYELSPSPAAQEAAQRACADFAAYVEALATARASRPGDDLLTSLVEARDGSDRLSPRELVATVVLLLNAGHEASVNGFGNGLASLLAQPDERDRVLTRLDDDAAVERLVEEVLRHDSPLQLFERTATADVELHGVTVRRGQKVAVLLGAANRDPEVFAEPDAFRADRDPNPHLAFGAGLHFCLGAPLARMELQVSLRALLRRVGPVEVVEAVRRPTFVLRGYERLSVGRA